jgi:hypothetical protein
MYPYPVSGFVGTIPKVTMYPWDAFSTASWIAAGFHIVNNIRWSDNQNIVRISGKAANAMAAAVFLGVDSIYIDVFYIDFSNTFRLK